MPPPPCHQQQPNNGRAQKKRCVTPDVAPMRPSMVLCLKLFFPAGEARGGSRVFDKSRTSPCSGSSSTSSPFSHVGQPGQAKGLALHKVPPGPDMMAV